jgi:putative ATP-binding cassette transporter
MRRSVSRGGETSAYRLDPAVARAFARFAGGFWTSGTARRAWTLTLGLLGLLLLSTLATLLLNHWNRWFFDSLEERDTAALTQAVLWFALIIAGMAAVGVGIVYTREALQVRWREWIVAGLLDRWLGEQRFQQLNTNGQAPQNPEYRIADDSRWATEPLVDLGIGLVLAAVNAAAFIAILWQVGGSYVLKLGDAASITIPAYLVIVALIYGAVASALTLKVGASLPGAVARRNEAEGHFRFGMMRLRDNAESVSLMQGGAGERAILARSYFSLVTCWMAIVRQHVRLTWITNASGPMIPIIPLLFAAPKYISGELSLGQVTQLAAAFVQVQMAISWLVDHYGKVAEWYASARRVVELVDACEAQDGSKSTNPASADSPSARQALVPPTLEPGRWIQVIGQSSSGKSTMVRGFADHASPSLSPGQHLMILPQRDYLPPGTLREVLSYPASNVVSSPELLGAALNQVGLGSLISRLDAPERWDTVLSRGERQRLSLARLLVHRPKAIIIDDALTALDERTQLELLESLRHTLPESALIWFGRRKFQRTFDDVLFLDSPDPSGAQS